MEIFQFNGDWETTLHLPIFVEFLNKQETIHSIGQELWDLRRFPMTIKDEPNDLPEPTGAQFATIRFIQENQVPIFNEISDFLKKKLYPEYDTNSSIELSFSFSKLEIEFFEKDGMAFYCISNAIDYEYGLWLHMHGLKIVNAGMDDKKLIEPPDRVEHETLWVESLKKHWGVIEDSLSKIKESGIYLPKEYGKLKPWQEYANGRFPLQMLCSEDFEAFKIFFQNETNAKYCDVEGLLTTAVSGKHHQFIDFLLSQKPKDVFSAIMNAIDVADLPVIKRLAHFEKNINDRRGHGYLYMMMRKLYHSKFNLEKRQVYETAIEHFIRMGANPYLKDLGGNDVFHPFFQLNGYNIDNEQIQIVNFVEGLCKKYGLEPDQSIK